MDLLLLVMGDPILPSTIHQLSCLQLREYLLQSLLLSSLPLPQKITLDMFKQGAESKLLPFGTPSLPRETLAPSSSRDDANCASNEGRKGAPNLQRRLSLQQQNRSWAPHPCSPKEVKIGLSTVQRGPLGYLRTPDCAWQSIM